MTLLFLDCVGHSGVEHPFFLLLYFSTNHINVELENNILENWYLTDFYRVPRSGRRRDSWTLLRLIHFVRY